MQFQPRSEKEIQEAALWPAGTYDFEVVEAKPAVGSDTSKNPGVEFIKLKLKIFNQEGATRFVNGILHPAMEAQLRHFCYATGAGELYEKGQLRADHCENRNGRLKLKIGKEQNGYPAKNEVADYIVGESKPSTARQPEGSDAFDPFADDVIP